MEAVTVPSDDKVDVYYALLTAETLMPQPLVAQGGVPMNLACFCPVPLAWAFYFLDFKSPHEAVLLGRELVATMTNVGDQNWAGPILDWLWAACVRLGPTAAY